MSTREHRGRRQGSRESLTARHLADLRQIRSFAHYVFSASPETPEAQLLADQTYPGIPEHTRRAHRKLVEATMADPSGDATRALSQLFEIAFSNLDQED